MKIIFSRKGFDSTAGGIPSPIFADDTFCSFPILFPRQEPKLKDVRFRGTNLGSLVGQLSNNPNISKAGVHLDPDLNRNARPRKAGWRPCFGQIGAAQTHLAKHHVGDGDIFLFFGWFRRVITTNGRLRFHPEAQGIHCLFGWLQVGAVNNLGMDGSVPPKWALEHPHVKDANHYRLKATNNTLYMASERLRLPGHRRQIAGGGIFPYFNKSLQLTEPDCQRSIWRLPDCFYPIKAMPPLSYHVDLERWHRDKKGVLLRTVGRGQEFVLDCDFYPGVIEWLKDVFKAAPIG